MSSIRNTCVVPATGIVTALQTMQVGISQEETICSFVRLPVRQMREL